MRTFPVVSALLVAAAVGCHGPHACRHGCEDACTAPLPACPAPAPACPAPAPTPTAQAFATPPTPAPGVPAQAFATPGFAPGTQFVNAEVRERQTIGFEFTTIKIPFPWLRLRVTPLPSEVTFRGQPAPTGFAAPPAAPAGFGLAAAGGGPMVFTGSQMVPVTGTQTVQVPVGQAALPAAQAVPPPVWTTPAQAQGATAADELEAVKKRLKECEELQAKLKALQPAP